MVCLACNKLSNLESEDCFQKALDVLKIHYKFYRNALEQRDLELKQIKERNEKLNKALELLQNSQQPPKRFKSQFNVDSLLLNNDERVTSDLSLTDDEPVGVSNLNMAFNSEQLLDASALSPAKNNTSITSSSELVRSPRIKESPKKNRQKETMKYLNDRENNSISRLQTERVKERDIPSEKLWATKFLKPNQTEKASVDKVNRDTRSTDKRLRLSLKKTNPSKMKQSLIHFNRSKEGSFHESDTGDDVIDASPVLRNTNLKAGRSWAHRSGNNHGFHNIISSKQSVIALTNAIPKKRDSNKTVENIVFDFSPTKKKLSVIGNNSLKEIQNKQLKYDNDMSTDCTSLPNDQLGVSAAQSNTSSVVILTPCTQDIIFVDDSCNEAVDIDTMDLLADVMKKGSEGHLGNLKKYENKSIQKQQKELQLFKNPSTIQGNSSSKIKSVCNIKQEKTTQDLEDQTKLKQTEYKPSCSSRANSPKKLENPLYATDEPDEEAYEDMPKPIIIKQEKDDLKSKKKITTKERFNTDCEDCEKLIKFFEGLLTDEELQEHIDKCKHHKNVNVIRANTPPNFWNPFILSFQADDPRNEVLIDNRFKDKKS